MAPLIQAAHHLSIWPMDTKQTAQWLTMRADALDLTFNAEAKHHALEQTECCPIALWQLLQQLALLNRPNPIDVTTLEGLTHPPGSLSMFSWHEGIVLGQWARAIEQLPRLQQTCELIPLLALLQKTMDQMIEILYLKSMGILTPPSNVYTLGPNNKRRYSRGYCACLWPLYCTLSKGYST